MKTSHATAAMLTLGAALAWSAAHLEGRAEAPEPIGPFDCLIQPSATAELSAPVSGVVSQVLVDRGDRVRTGQIVARLYAGLEKTRLTIARARADAKSQIALRHTRLAFENRRLARNRKLMETQVITEKEADEIRTAQWIARIELDQAREESNLLRLQVQQALADLALREVRSTINGVVINVARQPGESTDRVESYILKVVSLDPLFAEVFVPIRLSRSLSRGQGVTLVSDVLAERRIAGRISVIDPVADAASGMTRVRITIHNADHAIPAGIRCQATFVRE
ncbi:MAG: efflux RND transporter periplasmic adaptor subunit [Pseudomonadota bacterium]